MTVSKPHYRIVLLKASAVVLFFSFVFPYPTYAQSPDLSTGAVVSLPQLSQPSFTHVPHARSILNKFSMAGRAGVAVLPDTETLTLSMAQTIRALGDPNTGIAASHYGFPGFEQVTFTYDATVQALMLKAAGDQQGAEKIMDYFAQRLRLPAEDIIKQADTNGNNGILKVMRNGEAVNIGIINAFDRSSLGREGQGKLEYVSTPGPTAFIVMAMLNINRTKYINEAVMLGKALLAMQDGQGGIHDGDRNPRDIYTEPHMDTLSAFMQLYTVTGDTQWLMAAQKAYRWFRNHVYDAKEGIIHQGIGPDGAYTIFATDAYSWTMAGKAGDWLPLDDLARLTDKMLKQCLVRITLPLPGGKTTTMLSVDFTDPLSAPALKARGGAHAMGSQEWVGGVILALQKNAVRFWRDGRHEEARFYKAMAKLLTRESLKGYYEAEGLVMTFYATGQGMAVGHGWDTPYFFVDQPVHHIAGGSLVGGWMVMPANGVNPFELDDNYFDTFGQIEATEADRQAAQAYADKAAVSHAYTETMPTALKKDFGHIVEPGEYNKKAWTAFGGGDYANAIMWASKVVNEPTWMRLAKEEQAHKAKELGGLVDYPWGKSFANNDSALHKAVWKYPLLNEVGTAMWLLAASYFAMDKPEEAGQWIKRIVEEVPYHQIANVTYDPQTGKKDLIDGYWNAVVSWVDNPGSSQRDAKMGQLMRHMGLTPKSPASRSI